jgi:hypothetical protein
MKHLRPERTAKIKVGSEVIRCNTQAMSWLGVWMDVHLNFQEQYNRCMKKARTAEARLRTQTATYGMVLERVRAVQVE